MTELNPLRARIFTVRMRSSGSVHKILKIGFTKSDGSVWIAFPYFQDSRGLASLVVLPPGDYYPTASLTDHGLVTSHLVKYMHHRSGLALFSQSGRVVSSMRKASVPLSVADGHLASIVVTELSGFREDVSGKPDVWKLDEPAPPTQTITFAAKSPDPPSIKFVVWCYGKKRLREHAVGKSVGPVMMLGRPDEAGVQQGVLIAAPRYAAGSSTYLALQAYPIPRETKEPGPHLTLIGGFDPPEISYDHSKPLSFLALSYPTDYEKFKQTLGSMDLVAEVEQQRTSADALPVG